MCAPPEVQHIAQCARASTKLISKTPTMVNEEASVTGPTTPLVSGDNMLKPESAGYRSRRDNSEKASNSFKRCRYTKTTVGYGDTDPLGVPSCHSANMLMFWRPPSVHLLSACMVGVSASFLPAFARHDDFDRGLYFGVIAPSAPDRVIISRFT